MVEIKAVLPGSIAEELDIKAEDQLISIDDREITDYIDYQYGISADFFILTIKKKNGELWDFEIEKAPDENLGLVFDGIIYDRLKKCCNNCIFCFVKQQPEGLRDSLLIKDDDYRFSFLQGSFITLTNLKEDDLKRIINLRLSPLYISVHTTNPGLRVKMMKNPEAACILEKLSFLADNGIDFHTQLVLCPSYNDGEELDKSIRDLADFYPSLLSIGVVPVGLTKYRAGLPFLKSFDREGAVRVLEQIKRWQEKFIIEFGTNFLYAADEFYFLADEKIPDLEDYGEFPQIENGIGLTRLLWEEFSELVLPEEIERKNAGIITGILGQKALEPVVNGLKKIKGLNIHTIPVENDFFGRTVTVTGLLTGIDIINKLKKMDTKAIDFIFLPDILLNENGFFLDDLEKEDLEREFPDIKFFFVKNVVEMLEVLESAKTGGGNSRKA